MANAHQLHLLVTSRTVDSVTSPTLINLSNVVLRALKASLFLMEESSALLVVTTVWNVLMRLLVPTVIPGITCWFKPTLLPVLPTVVNLSVYLIAQDQICLVFVKIVQLQPHISKVGTVVLMNVI
jgi:hypothetical protein